MPGVPGGKQDTRDKGESAVDGLATASISKQHTAPTHARGKSIKCTFILFSRCMNRDSPYPMMLPLPPPLPLPVYCFPFKYKYKSSAHLSLLNDNNGRSKRWIPEPSHDHRAAGARSGRQDGRTTGHSPLSLPKKKYVRTTHAPEQVEIFHEFIMRPL